MPMLSSIAITRKRSAGDNVPHITRRAHAPTYLKRTPSSPPSSHRPLPEPSTTQGFPIASVINFSVPSDLDASREPSQDDTRTSQALSRPTPRLSIKKRKNIETDRVSNTFTLPIEAPENKTYSSAPLAQDSGRNSWIEADTPIQSIEGPQSTTVRRTYQPTSPRPVSLSPIGSDDEYEPSIAESDSSSTVSGLSTPPVIAFQGAEVEPSLEQLCERLAAFIDDTMSLRNIGCDDASHASAHQQHVDTTPATNHHPLAATSKAPRKMSYKHAQHASRLGLASTDWPKPMGRGRADFAEASTIRASMEGRKDDTRDIKNICLHTEPRLHVQYTVEYDMDSIIGFMPTLAGFKTEIELVAEKLISFNISSNLHFNVRVTQIDENGQEIYQMRQVKDMRHLYLGRSRDIPSSVILICFPHIPKEGKSTLLRDVDANRFFDEILLPAWRACMTSGRVQHLPPNTKVAQDKSRAKYREQQSGKSQHKSGAHRHYPMPAADLPAIVQAMESIISNDKTGLQLFRDAIICVDAKNLKLLTKSTSPLHVITRHIDLLDKVFHDSVVVANDLAVEGTPVQPHQPTHGARDVSEQLGCTPFSTDGSRDRDSVFDTEDPPSTDQSAAYLFKACCQTTFAARLQKELFGGAKGNITMYNNGYLRDVTSMTFTPPSSSPAHKAGLVFGQLYNNVKGVEDAQKLYPFKHSKLGNLALPAHLHESVARGTKREALELSYNNCKSRVKSAYTSSNDTSMGFRIELRFLRLMLPALRDRFSRSDQPPLSPRDSPPSFVWSIPMKTWSGYMLGNYHKITSLIEMAVMCSPATGVASSTAQAVAVLLTYLANFGNCQARRVPLLWKDIRLREGGTDDPGRYGLGMYDSLFAHGYAWMLPRIDWERFAVYPQYMDALLGLPTTIARHCKVSARLAIASQDHLHVCFTSLSGVDPGSRRERVILSLMADQVIRQYRRDVLDLLASKGELREQYTSEEAKDGVPFSVTGITEALIQEPLLVKGNAMKTKDPVQVFEWIMGRETIYNRHHMDGGPHGENAKPFRSMLKQVWRAFEHDQGRLQRWHAQLLHRFQKRIWCIPYPHTNGLFMHGERGKHKFYSTGMDGKDWTWLREQARAGMPPPWPQRLCYDSGRLQRYINQYTSRS